MDLSKVFDTLNFDILLRKLQHYGINDVSLNLIKSYLTNRFQYVQYENADSGLLEVLFIYLFYLFYLHHTHNNGIHLHKLYKQ